VQDEWGIASGVTLTAGLRGEQIRFDSDGTEQQYRRLLPSLAVRWEPAALWILRSSLGTGIKAPRLDELSNQPVVSVSTNTPIEPDRRGNPNLRAERSVNFEAVLERYLPGDTGVFGANLYVRHTRDFVERRVQQEGVRWVDRPQNEGTARHWGMELDGKLRTDKLGWKGATFRTHLTLPRSRVQDERLGIAREARETPRYQLTGGYDQTMGSYSFGASFHHFGKVRTGVGSEQNAETRPRTLIDAYTLTRIDANLNLRLALQNLLRTDTRRLVDMTGGGNSYHLDTADRGVRTVLLSLEGKW
jgi:iron complex outermembrane receptor protein